MARLRSYLLLLPRCSRRDAYVSRHEVEICMHHVCVFPRRAEHSNRLRLASTREERSSLAGGQVGSCAIHW